MAVCLALQCSLCPSAVSLLHRISGKESGLCGYLMLIWGNHDGFCFLFVCFMAS